MKLRMLNGTHSMLAYAGFIAGHRYVRDCMGDPALASLSAAPHERGGAHAGSGAGHRSRRNMPSELLDRFANPAIAHETWQIAMDGTQKLPQRLIEAGGDRARTAACRWTPTPSPWRPGCATPSA